MDEKMRLKADDEDPTDKDSNEAMTKMKMKMT